MPGHLRAPAQPGGVHQHHLAAVELDAGVDRVARGAGHVGVTITRSSPSSRFTSEDLPTFGRPISASRRRRPPPRPPSLGQALDDQVEQVAGAEPLGGRDRQRVAEAEPVELGRQARSGAGVVDLVGGHDHRHAAAAQLARQLGVAGPQAGAGVHHEHGQVGVGQRGAGLARGSASAISSSSARSTPPVSTSVKRAPVPVGLHLLAVARDARPARAPRSRACRTGGSRASTCRRSDSRRRRPSGGSSARAARTSSTIRSTTSSTVQPGGVELDGVRRPAAAASARGSQSCASRSAWSRSTVSTSVPSSAARRRARSSGSAVRKTFTAASGATTVPMSRPSATQSPLREQLALLLARARRARAGWSRPARPPRTPRARGWPRSRPRPFAITRSPSSMLEPLARCSDAAPPCAAASCSPTARYIAPESR